MVLKKENFLHRGNKGASVSMQSLAESESAISRWLNGT